MKRFSMLSLALMTVLGLAGCGQPKTVTPAPVPSNTPVVAETTVAPAESFNGTLEQLMTQGKSVACHTVSDSDGTKMEGDFYIDNKGGRTRSNSTITTQNMPTQETMMIMDKDFVYMWTAGEKTGFKYPVIKDEPVTDDQINKSKLPEAQKDIRKEKFDFKCQTWQVDESMFAVPTEITFSDPMAGLNDIKAPKAPSQAEIQKMIDDAKKIQ